MRKIIFVTIISWISIASFAQNEMDALRYTYLWHGGNARYISMGGAFGALGANTSAFSLNPAGIGLYNNPEFNISPSILNTSSNSYYNGGQGEDSRLNAGISHIGIVLTNEYLKVNTRGKWKNVQFGFAINQLKNFNRKAYINGNNNTNSISDMYAELAKGVSVQEIEDNFNNEFTYDLNPAWWSYLFNNIENTNTYVGNAPPGGVFQGKFIESWGSLNEVSLTFGANYDDLLYFGATIGIPYFNYKERTLYTEDALREDIPESTYRSIAIHDRLDSQGTGINLKLGIIARATDWMRLGLAIHTPTYYAQIKDEWDMTINSSWDSFTDESNSSDIGYFEYNLSSSLKAVTSVAFIIKKYGLISADFEVVDYSKSSLDSPNYHFPYENQDIRSLYKATGNLRLGTEWRVANFSFRGGFNYYGNPYRGSVNDGSATSYSFGLGFKERNFYLDIAWVTTDQSEDYYLYGYKGVSVNKAVNDFRYSNFVLTYGIRF